MPSRTHEVLPVLVDPLPQTFCVLVAPLLEATVSGRGGEGETRQAGWG